MIKAKTFLNFLENYTINEKELEKLLKDNRLTVLEKKILKGWINIRKCKFEEIIADIESMSKAPDQLIEAQKELLLGIAYINKSESQKALDHLQKSLDFHAPFKLPRQEFIILTNLFYAYFNLKNKMGMEDTINQLKAGHYQKNGEILLINRINFGYLAYIGNYGEAEEILEEIEKSPLLKENQLLYHLISKFDFFVKIDNYQGCQQILAQIKKAKDYHIGANYKFMSLLLDHFISNKSLYVYERDFAGHPILWNQIAVIKNLEEKNIELAKKHWNYLRTISPQTYKSDFAYEGDKCLFSRCLEKNLMEKTVVQLPTQQHLTKKEDLLIHLLETQGAISKEELYYQLWGEYAPDKLSFNKLERMISTIRKNHPHNIKFKKGTYFLEKKAA